MGGQVRLATVGLERRAAVAERTHADGCRQDLLLWPYEKFWTWAKLVISSLVTSRQANGRFCTARP
jgi:hypothetical protein